MPFVHSLQRLCLNSSFSFCVHGSSIIRPQARVFLAFSPSTSCLLMGSSSVTVTLFLLVLTAATLWSFCLLPSGLWQPSLSYMSNHPHITLCDPCSSSINWYSGRNSNSSTHSRPLGLESHGWALHSGSYNVLDHCHRPWSLGVWFGPYAKELWRQQIFQTLVLGPFCSATTKWSLTPSWADYVWLITSSALSTYIFSHKMGMLQRTQICLIGSSQTSAGAQISTRADGHLERPVFLSL